MALPLEILYINISMEWMDAWLLVQALHCVLHNVLHYAAIAKTTNKMKKAYEVLGV